MCRKLVLVSQSHNSRSQYMKMNIECFREEFPFSYAVIAQEQPNDPELMNRYTTSELYDKKVYKHADKEYDLVIRTDEGTNQTKIVFPKLLQQNF